MRLIGGDFVGNLVWPNAEKLWLAVEATEALTRRKRTTPLVGIYSWSFLLCRCLLSCFFDVYV